VKKSLKKTTKGSTTHLPQVYSISLCIRFIDSLIDPKRMTAILKNGIEVREVKVRKRLNLNGIWNNDY